MPDLTPDLPAQYRRSALVALDVLLAQAAGDVDEHRTLSAWVSLGFAEDRLSLLRDRQRFLLTPELEPI
jgi:hypothetical protein